MFSGFHCCFWEVCCQIVAPLKINFDQLLLRSYSLSLIFSSFTMIGVISSNLFYLGLTGIHLSLVFIVQELSLQILFFSQTPLFFWILHSMYVEPLILCFVFSLLYFLKDQFVSLCYIYGTFHLTYVLISYFLLNWVPNMLLNLCIAFSIMVLTLFNSSICMNVFKQLLLVSSYWPFFSFQSRSLNQVSAYTLK